ncbi:MAG: NADH-quinone oxidoreductase subunit J [Fimbriimonadaceae bacterium]
MTLNQIAFIVLAVIALLGGIGVVFLKSPVRSALALVLNFFTLGLVYFMLGNQMIGISQIVVYAGAIMVLFLFVIMILRSQHPEEDQSLWKDRRFVFGLLGGTLTVALIYNFVILPTQTTYGAEFDRTYGTPQAIGKFFFTQFVYPFEVISILLLLGVVGSIMLAKRKF